MCLWRSFWLQSINMSNPRPPWSKHNDIKLWKVMTNQLSSTMHNCHTDVTEIKQQEATCRIRSWLKANTILEMLNDDGIYLRYNLHIYFFCMENVLHYMLMLQRFAKVMVSAIVHHQVIRMHFIEYKTMNIQQINMFQQQCNVTPLLNSNASNILTVIGKYMYM